MTIKAQQPTGSQKNLPSSPSLGCFLSLPPLAPKEQSLSLCFCPPPSWRCCQAWVSVRPWAVGMLILLVMPARDCLVIVLRWMSCTVLPPPHLQTNSFTAVPSPEASGYCYGCNAKAQCMWTMSSTVLHDALCIMQINYGCNYPVGPFQLADFS